MRRHFGVVLLILSLGLLFVAEIGLASLGTPSTNLIEATKSQTQATRQMRFSIVREYAAAEAAYDPNELNWAGKDADANWVGPIPPTWNRVEFTFDAYGDGTGDGDPNAGAATISIYAGRQYCSPCKVWSGTLGVGEVELTHDPNSGLQINSGALDPNQSYKVVDTITSTAAPWPATVLSDSTGTAGVNYLDTDARGYPYWRVRVTGLSGVTTLYVRMTGY